jgi:hypothetical protein
LQLASKKFHKVQYSQQEKISKKNRHKILRKKYKKKGNKALVEKLLSIERLKKNELNLAANMVIKTNSINKKIIRNQEIKIKKKAKINKKILSNSNTSKKISSKSHNTSPNSKRSQFKAKNK